ncbi:MAG TPA: ATP12 family protein [Roseiarcus sp.]|jgi:chaperone required for assembly of F1-ATPase|nr:ATP12 family protein [Roseiarcus sp.]
MSEMNDAPRDPMRAAQAKMRPQPVRRFYSAVEVREADGRHALMLDGRGARTPGRNPLSATSRALMLEVAAEWERQHETIDPAEMPLTRLLNSAIDGVAHTMAETRADILRYAGSDLLCYRAEEPEALVERQAHAFDPILRWAAETLGARFNVTAGVMHVAQPHAALAAIGAALEAYDDPAALAALSVITTLTGSALLALAVARGFLSPESAWQAAHIDEDFQAERWGADAEATARREARWREFEAAAIVVGAMSAA